MSGGEAVSLAGSGRNGYELVIPLRLERAFKKLKKKDPVLLERIQEKLEEVLRNPFEVGTPKKYELKGCYGVHIGPWVLMWTVENRKVILVRFEHHDHAYD